MIKQRFFSQMLVLYLILGTWKGYVALFEAGKEEPRQIFPTAVASVPEENQMELEKGIVIRNDKQLQQILEEYLS